MSLPDRMENQSSELPQVLRCLFDEHRHLAALLRALEGKARQAGVLQAGDYYLMRDILGYLHDYPDQVHHPTENLLFEKMLRREPSRKNSVKRLRSDHGAVALETKNLLGLLDEVIDEPTQLREHAIRRACEVFIKHQRQHIRFENQEMFPAAIESLLPADWEQIEAHFAAVDDPLFGQFVGSQHRLLYEYLLNPADKATERFRVSRFFSLERLILAMDIMDQATDSWFSRLKDLGEEVSRETRSTVSQSLQPDSLGSAIGLPLKYVAFMGKSLLGCSADLARISTATARDTLALYGARKPD